MPILIKMLNLIKILFVFRTIKIIKKKYLIINFPKIFQSNINFFKLKKLFHKMNSSTITYTTLNDVYDNHAYDEFEQNINTFLDFVNVFQ